MATEKLKFLVTADTKNFALGMKAVAALAVTAFAAAVKVSADFEKALSKLRAVSGATGQEMGELKKQARDLGKSTAFTAVEVAKLQVELAKLGFTSNDILNSSGGILDLAASLGVELSEAAVLAGSTIRAFGLTTEDTGRVVDVLAKATASSALDFGKLTESLKLAAPIAKLYNFTIEDTVAMLGQLANAGIHGSQAGTGLRQIFLELDKKGISLNDALTQVNESSNKAGTAFDLVGKRAAGVLAIIADGKGDIDELAQELYNAEGAANEMRNIMEDNLIGDFDKLKSAVTDMGLEMGEVTTGPMRSFIQSLTDMITGGDDALSFIGTFRLEMLKIEEAALTAWKGMILLGEAIKNFGNTNIISPEAALQLLDVEERLKAITREIVGVYVAAGKKGTKYTPKPVGPLKKVKKTKNIVGGGGSEITGNSGFGPGYNEKTGSFFDKELLNASGFKQYQEGLKKTTEVAQESFDGIGLAASAAAGLVGQFTASLLGPDSSALERAGVSIIGTLASIAIAAAVAGASESAAGTGPAAIFTLPTFIALALGAVGAALSGTGASVSSSGGGGGGQGAISSSSVTPSSLQGVGTGGQLVATVRGQDLRFVLQGANDNYTALN